MECFYCSIIYRKQLIIGAFESLLTRLARFKAAFIALFASVFVTSATGALKYRLSSSSCSTLTLWWDDENISSIFLRVVSFGVYKILSFRYGLSNFSMHRYSQLTNTTGAFGLWAAFLNYSKAFSDKVRYACTDVTHISSANRFRYVFFGSAFAYVWVFFWRDATGEMVYALSIFWFFSRRLNRFRTRHPTRLK